jgi:ABC-type glycerol-3-phosphate transport system permease component
MANIAGTTTNAGIKSYQVVEAVKKIMVYLVLAAGAIIVAIPFVWSLSTSLKIPSQISTFPPQWIPEPVAWWNYVDALNAYPFGRWFMNTFVVVLTSTFGTIFSASMVAFSFARLRWPGRDVFFLLLLTTMMLPSQVTLIPTYILFKEIGWVNTFYPLVVPAFFARNAFYIFLLRQFFMTIPLDLDDAARLDGAGHWQVYWHLMLPMSKPALAVAAIMFAQFKWKEFLAPLIFLHDSKMYTVALGLRAFISQTWGIEWNYLMAANIVFMLPLVIIFFFAQRYFIQGVVITGLKG